MFSEPLLKRRSLFAMIGFGILSFGLYFPLWFLRRRTALNALHSGRKLQLWPFSLAFAIQTVTIVMVFGGLPTLEGTPPGDALWPLIRLGYTARGSVHLAARPAVGAADLSAGHLLSAVPHQRARAGAGTECRTGLKGRRRIRWPKRGRRAATGSSPRSSLSLAAATS